MGDYDYIITPAIIVIGNFILALGFYFRITKPLDKYRELLDDIKQLNSLIIEGRECIEKCDKNDVILCTQKSVRVISLLRLQCDLIMKYNIENINFTLDSSKLNINELDTFLTDRKKEEEIDIINISRIFLILEKHTLNIRSIAVEHI